MERVEGVEEVEGVEKVEGVKRCCASWKGSESRGKWKAPAERGRKGRIIKA